jgi:hypothetical protein
LFPIETGNYDAQAGLFVKTTFNSLIKCYHSYFLESNFYKGKRGYQKFFTNYVKKLDCIFYENAAAYFLPGSLNDLSKSSSSSSAATASDSSSPTKDEIYFDI